MFLKLSKKQWKGNVQQHRTLHWRHQSHYAKKISRTFFNSVCKIFLIFQGIFYSVQLYIYKYSQIMLPLCASGCKYVYIHKRNVLHRSICTQKLFTKRKCSSREYVGKSNRIEFLVHGREYSHPFSKQRHRYECLCGSFAITKNFAKPFLRVHMGPRWSFLSKKVSKFSDTVPKRNGPFALFFGGKKLC